MTIGEALDDHKPQYSIEEVSEDRNGQKVYLGFRIKNRITNETDADLRGGYAMPIELMFLQMEKRSPEEASTFLLGVIQGLVHMNMLKSESTKAVPPPSTEPPLTC